MTTLNQQIMHEIHNEQRELNSSLSGREIFRNMRKLGFLDSETKPLLWRGVELQRTYFGEGMMLDKESISEMHENQDMHDSFGMFFKAMITAGIKFDKNPKENPLDILAHELAEGFSLIMRTSIDSEDMYDFLSGLLECETLAAWLLVSPIYGYKHKDIDKWIKQLNA